MQFAVIDIDFGALLKVVLASFGGTVALTVTLTLAVVGAAKGAEARRQGRQSASLVYSGVLVLGMTGVAALVVLGLIVMTSK